MSDETKHILLTVVNDAVTRVTGESPEHQQRRRAYTQEPEITIEQATEIAKAFTEGKWMVIWSIANLGGLIDCPELAHVPEGKVELLWTYWPCQVNQSPDAVSLNVREGVIWSSSLDLIVGS